MILNPNSIKIAEMMIMNPAREKTKNQKIRQRKKPDSKKMKKMPITENMKKRGTMSSFKVDKDKLEKIQNAEKTYNRKKVKAAVLDDYKNKNETLIHSENNSFMKDRQLGSIDGSFVFDGKNEVKKKVRIQVD